MQLPVADEGLDDHGKRDEWGLTIRTICVGYLDSMGRLQLCVAPW